MYQIIKHLTLYAVGWISSLSNSICQSTQRNSVLVGSQKCCTMSCSFDIDFDIDSYNLYSSSTKPLNCFLLFFGPGFSYKIELSMILALRYEEVLESIIRHVVFTSAIKVINDHIVCLGVLGW